ANDLRGDGERRRLACWAMGHGGDALAIEMVECRTLVKWRARARAHPAQLPLQSTEFNDLRCQDCHFVTATVVPRLGSDSIRNSSTSRRIPGSPRPRPPEVEKPSRMASLTSAIPGPSSWATIRIP